MLKPSINLLQAELQPEKPLFTLKNIVMVWGLSLAIMVGLSVYTNWQVNQLTVQANELERQHKQLQQHSNELQAKLASHKADSALVAELDTLTSLAQDKRFLYSHLTNTDYSYIGGFAAAMAELAELHSKDISLEHIVIQDNQILFSGIARNPNAVPAWLDNFNKSQVLAGKLFQQFKMAEREDKLISFTVSSDNAELAGGGHAAVE